MVGTKMPLPNELQPASDDVNEDLSTQIHAMRDKAQTLKLRLYAVMKQLKELEERQAALRARG